MVSLHDMNKWKICSIMHKMKQQNDKKATKSRTGYLIKN